MRDMVLPRSIIKEFIFEDKDRLPKKLYTKPIKVKIEELYGKFCSSNFSPNRDIEELKKDIKDNGLLTPPFVVGVDVGIINNRVARAKLNNTQPSKKDLERLNVFNKLPKVKYYVSDGNHRCFALRELYGDDYELNVKI